MNRLSRQDGGDVPTGRVKPVGVETIRARAYNELKQALLEGRFRPGEQLTVRTVAEELEIGTMPVREAIQQLVTEGGLEFLPNRSVRVPQLSFDCVEIIFTLRLLLEGFAVQQASKNIRPDDLADLKTSFERMKATLRGASPAEALAANFNFHFQVYEVADSSYLYKLIERLWLRVGPLLIEPYQAAGASKSASVATLGAHKDLLAALSRKDGQAAEAALRKIVDADLDWHRTHTFAD